MTDDQVTLQDALIKLNARKEAICPTPGELIEGEDQVRLLLVGYEIPIEEMGAWANIQANMAAEHLLAGEDDPGLILKGQAMDGFIMGVVFERLRNESQGS